MPRVAYRVGGIKSGRLTTAADSIDMFDSFTSDDLAMVGSRRDVGSSGRRRRLPLIAEFVDSREHGLF